MIDDASDSLILPMVRMDRDPVQGLIREPVTCVAFQVERVKYVSKAISNLWLEDLLTVTRVRLPDIDDELCTFNALMRKGHAVTAFSEACAVIAHNRTAEHGQHDSEGRPVLHWGYDIPPVGICDFLGYNSDTAAWLVIHPQGPALLVREGNELEDDLNRWLEYWYHRDDVPKTWPRKEDGRELCVENAMRKLTTLSTRRRVPMSKAVARFICKNT